MIDRYYIADRIDELDNIINEFWKFREKLAKDGFLNENKDIEHYLVRSYVNLENVRDIIIDYGRFLKRGKKYE
jgi:hypothetical protein